VPEATVTGFGIVIRPIWTDKFIVFASEVIAAKT
jgi:hypothetical protein